MNIAVLPGDGIGPEIVEQALNVTKAICEKFGHALNYEYAIVGACAIDAVGEPYPKATHELCMKSDAVLFGAIGDPNTIMIRQQKYVLNKDCSKCVRIWVCMLIFVP